MLDTKEALNALTGFSCKATILVQEKGHCHAEEHYLLKSMHSLFTRAHSRALSLYKVWLPGNQMDISIGFRVGGLWFGRTYIWLNRCSALWGWPPSKLKELRLC